ncbi:hypothetical protein J4470_03435 [Candidatus Woesearchaeota archaeon]|nr:hypothetical protein [Candidatus Woesearchaeota archaeon]
MTSLVACIGSGKGTWTEVKKLIASESWEKVFLITNSFGKEKFQADAEFIVVDDLQPAQALTPVIISQLNGRINDTEVAVNISSGSGNLHMAIFSALLKLGLGIRLIALVNDKVEEL